MQAYLNLLRKVLMDGESHDDRTGVGTLSLWGESFRHRMRSGFPLITTKKVPLRLVFEELMWFLRGSTNEKELSEKNVTIWQEWATAEQCAKFGREEGDLGPVYGKQLRAFGEYSRSLIPVERREPSGMDYEPPFRIQQCTTWEVIGECKEKGRPFVTVRFGSGFERTIRKCQVTAGHIRDPYSVTASGVGYSGGFQAKSQIDKQLKKTWSHMLDRCYKKSCKEYKFYGAVGVSVCPKWHNLSEFIKDAKTLPGWVMKEKNPSEYQLDKDHFRASVYSPNTCIWIPKSMNSAYANRRPFIAKGPGGREQYGISVADFAEKHGLNSHGISRVIRGDRDHHKGWSFRECEDRGLGFSTPVDQVQSLLSDIKSNPNSRRLVVSMWNPVDAKQVALPPCHTLWQVKVHQSKRSMSLCLYARSIDIFLGLPFNIASYGLLLEMLCWATGYRPEHLVIHFGDLHLYKNHIPQAHVQLARQPHPLCHVYINKQPGNDPLESILGLKWTDIDVADYVHHPKIEAEVAV